MSKAVAILLIVYIAIATLVIIMLLSKADCGPSWRDKRDAARMAFFVPVWPVLLLYMLFRAVSRLWRLADWGRLR